MSLHHVEAALNALEPFICYMYSKDLSNFTSCCNAARYSLAMKGVDFKNMPPASDTLRQLVLRAAYVSGHCWGNSLSPIMNSPDPTLWGFKIDEAKTELKAIMTT